MSASSAKPAKPARFQSEEIKEIAWHVWSYFDYNYKLWSDDYGHYNFDDLTKKREYHRHRLGYYAIGVYFEFPRGWYLRWKDGSKVNPGILVRAWKRYQEGKIE